MNKHPGHFYVKVMISDIGLDCFTVSAAQLLLDKCKGSRSGADRKNLMQKGRKINRDEELNIFILGQSMNKIKILFYGAKIV